MKGILGERGFLGLGLLGFKGEYGFFGDVGFFGLLGFFGFFGFLGFLGFLGMEELFFLFFKVRRCCWYFYIYCFFLVIFKFFRGYMSVLFVLYY